MDKRGFFDKSDLKFVGLNVVLAVVVAIVILVCLIVWLKGYTQHGVEVEVEDVRGLVEAEAEPLLSAQGLRMIVVDSTYSDKVPFGTVVEQDPRPASHAKDGRLVYVIINATTNILHTDDSLKKIIIDGALPYFADQKSVDEVVKLIQSKAMLYVNEQR